MKEPSDAGDPMSSESRKDFRQRSPGPELAAETFHESLRYHQADLLLAVWRLRPPLL